MIQPACCLRIDVSERILTCLAGDTAVMVQLPAKGKLKGILFDIDGTLVNSDPLHYLA